MCMILEILSVCRNIFVPQTDEILLTRNEMKLIIFTKIAVFVHKTD